MASDLPITTAVLTALFAECVLYGVFLVSFVFCLRALLMKANGEFNTNIDRALVVVTLLMFTFSTMDVAFALRHILDAFVYYDGPAEEGVNEASYWVMVMTSVDVFAQGIIGDAVLIWRCWTVFRRNWLVIAPSLLMWLGGVACCIVSVFKWWSHHSANILNIGDVFPYLAALSALTLATNALTTSLMVWKIWSVDRQSRSAGRVATSASGTHRMSPLLRAGRIIIDSAALYTISVFIFAATYIANSNSSYIVSDSLVPIIGINFNVIIIRVRSGKALGSGRARTVSTWQAATLPVSTLQMTEMELPDRTSSSDVLDIGPGATQSEIGKGILSTHDSLCNV